MKDKRFVLIGDFNFPNIDWQIMQCLPTANKETQLFLNCIEDNFLVQHVNVPMRQNSILDLVISESLESVDEVKNI